MMDFRLFFSSFTSRVATSLLLGLLLVRSGIAADIYVNNQIGDDTNNGKSDTAKSVGVGPVKTLAAALRKARTGDTIRLAKTSEPYRESVTLQGGRHSGTPSQPFRIDGGGAIIDGTEPVAPGLWESAGGDYFRYRPNRLSHHQLFIDRKPVTRKYLKKGEHPKKILGAKEWCLYKGYVYFRVEPKNIPFAYNFTHSTKSVGITLYEVRNVVITNLTVQGFQLDGVNAHSNVMRTTLAELVCRGNGRSGISIGGASRLSVVATLIGNNGEAQVRSEGKSITELLNCDLIEAADAPAIVKHDSQIVKKND